MINNLILQAKLCLTKSYFHPNFNTLADINIFLDNYLRSIPGLKISYYYSDEDINTVKHITIGFKSIVAFLWSSFIVDKSSLESISSITAFKLFS